MPPFVTRKRHASTPSPEQNSAKKKKVADTSNAKNSPAVSSVHDKKKLLDSLAGSDDSSLSDADSDEFEDVMPEGNKNLRGEGTDEDEDIDWEDALQPQPATSAPRRQLPSGDLELTLGDHVETVSYMDGKKKGPSKRDREKRMDAHRMHVQFLMFHNCIRNAWACDEETQKILVSQLPSQIQQVVETWRRDCGTTLKAKEESKQQGQDEARKGNKKKRTGARNKQSEQRDWGGTAERLEAGTANLSHGDPTIRLLKYLAKYWQKHFHVTAPGLRKQGHKPVRQLQQEVASFRKDKHNHEEHGERISSIREFRQYAKRCEGSRDVGAQLFTALLRGLGVESRLVASLQPVGFGWGKNEEAVPKRRGQQIAESLEEPEASDIDSHDKSLASKNTHRKQGGSNRDSSVSVRKVKNTIQDGSKDTPFDLSSDSELSEVISESEESLMEVDPPPRKKKGTKRYDRDLKFPIYWTEAISPISHKVFPVDSMIFGAPATAEEQLMGFEPRGAKAEKAKQIIAYVIAYSADGTAKDVTTRYLKRHMWPGKTKGVRLPPEKMPVYNKRGKIKHYEEYDWFKTVMSGYKRRDKKRMLVDDIEDATDLKPAAIEKKAVKEGEESLQWYRQSADYCLERLLKREEALLPSAEPVKAFKSGKGENRKEEPVFRRQDVVPCKTEESWHKEGRQPKFDAQPLKYAPYRAVTTSRKREIEELTRRNNGVKPMQGLYSKDQTEYIIPPPIDNGVIPKNQFGNIDCFVPRMVPKGAVHLPYRGLVKICKKLEIDYAEAVTGFEFGNKMAVPVIQGVVIPAEHEDVIKDAWEEEEAKRQLREDQKRQTLILSTWRKFLMGLRILEKMRNEYGTDDLDHVKDTVNPFTNPNKIGDVQEREEDMQGGFVHDEEDEVDEGGFTGELEVIDARKSQGNVSLGGGFMTATPDESSDKVFDNSHEGSESSELSSQEEESPNEDAPNARRSVAKKAAQPENAIEALSSRSPRRRSARTRGQKSKYFEGNSDNSMDEHEEVGFEADAEQPRGRKQNKIQEPGPSDNAKTAAKITANKGKGRGRPRKTI